MRLKNLIGQLMVNYFMKNNNFKKKRGICYVRFYFTQQAII